ncbi:hypothetical protein Cmtc_58610 [Cupriavidus sp. TKC]|nr:hypothetical protein Cmtc_58610 [Cupriavidus sp. TKC]
MLPRHGTADKPLGSNMNQSMRSAQVAVDEAEATDAMIRGDVPMNAEAGLDEAERSWLCHGRDA